MEFLFAVIVASAIIGAICAGLGKGRVAATCAGVVPWLAMLVFLLYLDDWASANGLPATFDARTAYWPEQQLYLGTLVAVFGLIGYWATRSIINHRSGRAF